MTTLHRGDHVVLTPMFGVVIREEVTVLTSALHCYHRASFGFLTRGHPGVIFRLLQVVSWTFLSHWWPDWGWEVSSQRRHSPKLGSLMTTAGSVNSLSATGQNQGKKSGLMSTHEGQNQGERLRSGLPMTSLHQILHQRSINPHIFRHAWDHPLLKLLITCFLAVRSSLTLNPCFAKSSLQVNTLHLL